MKRGGDKGPLAIYRREGCTWIYVQAPHPEFLVTPLLGYSRAGLKSQSVPALVELFFRAHFFINRCDCMLVCSYSHVALVCCTLAAVSVFSRKSLRYAVLGTVCTLTTVPRSTQPSTLRGTVNEYQPHGRIIILGDDG